MPAVQGSIRFLCHTHHEGWKEEERRCEYFDERSLIKMICYKTPSFTPHSLMDVKLTHHTIWSSFWDFIRPQTVEKIDDAKSWLFKLQWMWDSRVTECKRNKSQKFKKIYMKQWIMYEAIYYKLNYDAI